AQRHESEARIDRGAKLPIRSYELGDRRNHQESADAESNRWKVALHVGQRHQEYEHAESKTVENNERDRRQIIDGYLLIQKQGQRENAGVQKQIDEVVLML